MKQHAVLTSQDGTIIVIISYANEKELIDKTREQINNNVLVAEIEPISDEQISLECTIVVYEKGQSYIPEDEFYLTPCTIV